MSSNQRLAGDQALAIDAGAFPGLSEIAPLWLARRNFRRVDALSAHGGGLETCSPAGAADLLLSALDGLGVVQGERQASPEGFATSACAMPFTSEQFLAMAASLGCGRASWAAVFSSARVADTVARLCASLAGRAGASEIDSKALQEAVEVLVSLAERELAGRKPYYAISVEMTGLGLDGEPLCQRLLLRGDNSYRVSAMIAALCTRALFEAPPRGGLYRAWQLLEPGRVIDALLHSGAIHTWLLVDLPLAATSTGMVDEGAL